MCGDVGKERIWRGWAVLFEGVGCKTLPESPAAHPWLTSMGVQDPALKSTHLRSSTKMMALPLTYGQEVEEEIGGNKHPGDEQGAIQCRLLSTWCYAYKNSEYRPVWPLCPKDFESVPFIPLSLWLLPLSLDDNHGLLEWSYKQVNPVWIFLNQMQTSSCDPWPWESSSGQSYCFIFLCISSLQSSQAGFSSAPPNPKLCFMARLLTVWFFSSYHVLLNICLATQRCVVFV